MLRATIHAVDGRTRRVVEPCAILLVCLSIVGCSGAAWKTLEIESGYQPPKAVTIIVDASESNKEVAEALTAGVVEELTSDGIKATVVSGTADVSANLTIVRWDPGSQVLRWMLGFGQGKAEIVVAVSGSVGLTGTANGWVTGGFVGGDSADAPTAAGHLIGKTIATGRIEHSPQSQSQSQRQR
jgi:hypothetical protein